MSNTNLSTPLYRAVAHKLRSSILQGKWKSGSLIPTELELCNQFSASRSTIRKALKTLAQEGVIDRKAGKGTWVTDERAENEEWRFLYTSDYPFPSQIKVEILQVDHIAPDLSDSFFGGFPSNGLVTRFKTLRSLRETPLAFTEVFMTASVAEVVLSNCDRGKDIYMFQILERTTGFRIKEVHETFDAVPALGEIAKKLDIMELSPLNLITRLFFDEGGNQVEASRAYLRPDVNKLKIIRVRQT